MSGRLNTAAMRSCPICGWRDIATTTVYAGQKLPCCTTCAKDEPLAGIATDLSVGARAVALARTCPGATSTEISDEMGLFGPDRLLVCVALWGAVRNGILRKEGRRHYGTDKQWKPTRAHTRKRAERRAA